MKTARCYGILCLLFCLWLLLFPPWMEFTHYSGSLGHHWIYSIQYEWGWLEYEQRSVWEPDYNARIDYHEMLYEAAIGFVVITLLFLVLPAFKMPIHIIKLLGRSRARQDGRKSS